MRQIVIKAEDLSKKYQLGTIGYGTLRHDLQAWWARIRGKEDPNTTIGEKSRLDVRGDFWALKDINFEIEDGDRVGIIGKNGAGKSTLLKILSHITRPTEGVVKIKGRVASLLEVGTGFHPELTGRENVFLNGSIMGMKRREIGDRFDKIVDFSGVEQFIDTPVKRYSSGMYVRLGFAVAAHLDPDILIVDEVLAVGDVAFQNKCLGKMKEVSEEGRTVLFVSHNMFSIQRLCRRGLLLEDGRIVKDGDVAETVKSYMGWEKSLSGEVSWADLDRAPGNDKVRLKAVRIVSQGRTTGSVDMDLDFQIEIDFWNLEPDARRLVSIDINNGIGMKVLLSANTPSACVKPDPWFWRKYPRGVFRATCNVPGMLLNDGLHTISVFLNDDPSHSLFYIVDVVSFKIVESGTMRKELTGPWVAVIRPRLDWQTRQLA